jgi:putative glycosyltransferase
VDLSIVATLYQSAPYLAEFHRRATTAARALTEDYEIVLVNDGSPDASLPIALDLLARDDHLKVIDLSRNFGHHKAMMTGLAHTRGQLVFLLDSDLEEEPELLTRFHTELKRSGADVVYGVQERRKGHFIEQFTGNAFYFLFNLLSNCPVPRNVTTARLMTKRYVASLVEHKDREVFLLGLWTITGFEQRSLLVTKHAHSPTTYNPRRKLAVLVNSVTSFSNRPLIFIFYLGCVISALAGAAALYLVIKRLFFGTLLAGWPSLIVSVWLLGGIMIFCLGIIGIYLSRVFTETKQRPYTVIRQVYERTAAGPR